MSSPFPGPLAEVSRLSKGWLGLCNWTPYVSRDQGRTWAVAENGLPAETRLVYARKLRDTVVGFGGGSFWRTVDNGGSWTPWNEGFEAGSILEMSFEAGDTSCVMIL